MVKQIFSALLAISLIAQPAFGSSKDFFWSISGFEGGLNSHISSYAIPDTQAASAINVRVNRRYGKLSKRESMRNHFDTGSSASVNGLHRFYKSDGTYKTIAATSTDLIIGDTSSTQTIQDGLTYFRGCPGRVRIGSN